MRNMEDRIKCQGGRKIHPKTTPGVDLVIWSGVPSRRVKRYSSPQVGNAERYVFSMT